MVEIPGTHRGRLCQPSEPWMDKYRRLPFSRESEAQVFDMAVSNRHPHVGLRSLGASAAPHVYLQPKE